jgi:WD40 repeat protein
MGHADRVISICFSPDGKTLASGSRDKTIKLWDVETGKVRLTLEGHTNWVTSLAFHPDGDRLASGGDITVRLWDTRTGKLQSTLQGHRSGVHSVSFSPDGSLLASAAGSIHTYANALDAHKAWGEITLWDVQTGKAKDMEMEHDLAARAVCFSPDGQALVSGGEDRTIKFWDPKTGQLTATIRGPFHKVVALAFSANGDALACASTLAPDPYSNQGRGAVDREDWEVRVWKFKNDPR